MENMAQNMYLYQPYEECCHCYFLYFVYCVICKASFDFVSVKGAIEINHSWTTKEIANSKKTEE